MLDIEVTGDVSDASRAPEWERRGSWISERLRQELGNRNIYTVLDNAPAADAIAAAKSNQMLHACNGCELDIAKRLGAERVLIGRVFRMSHLVLTLHVEVKEVATGRTVFRRALDFRGDNDTARERAVLFLVKETMGKAGA